MADTVIREIKQETVLLPQFLFVYQSNMGGIRIQRGQIGRAERSQSGVTGAAAGGKSW